MLDAWLVCAFFCKNVPDFYRNRALFRPVVAGKERYTLKYSSPCNPFPCNRTFPYCPTGVDLSSVARCTIHAREDHRPLHRYNNNDHRIREMIGNLERLSNCSVCIDGRCRRLYRRSNICTSNRQDSFRRCADYRKQWKDGGSFFQRRPRNDRSTFFA